MLRYPVGTTQHLAIFQEEIAIIHQRKSRKTESSTRRYLVCPSRQQLIELIVHIGMTNDFAARVGQQQAFDDSEFFASILIRARKVLRMPSQDIEKFFITAFAYRSTQLAHLLQ